MFVGYPENHAHDVFRLVNLKTNKIVLSCDMQQLNIKQAEHKNIKRSTTIIEEEEDKEKVVKEAIAFKEPCICQVIQNVFETSSEAGLVRIPNLVYSVRQRTEEPHVSIG